MTKLDQEIHDKYFALLDVVARLDAGIKHGAVTDVQQVRAVTSAALFRPQPTRGCAATNPATLAAKGEAV